MTDYRWLPDAFLPAEGAFLEALWLYACLTFGPRFFMGLDPVVKAGPPPVNLVWIWALLMLPVLASHWLEARMPDDIVRRRWLLTAMCTVLMLGYAYTQTARSTSLPSARVIGDAVLPWLVEPAGTVNGPAFSWLIGWALLAHGLWRAANEFDEGSATGWFLTGIIALLALLAVGLAGKPSRTDQLALGVIVGVYFCLGLTWLALCKQATLGDRVFGRLSSTLRPATIGTLLLGGAAMVAFAGLLTAGEGLALHGAVALRPAAAAAWPILGKIVVWPARFLFYDVAGPLLALLPPGLLTAKPTDQAPPSTSQQPQGGAGLPLPLPELLAGWLVFTAVVAIVIGVYIWRQRTRHDRVSLEIAAAQLAPWSWREMGRRLTAWWASGPHEPPSRPRAATLPGNPSVLAAYHAVLGWCAAKRQPRPPAATPNEFEPELSQLLPGELASRLTASYVRVRYGQAPDDPGLAGELLAELRPALESRPGPPNPVPGSG